MAALTDLTLSEALAKLRAGEISSVELTQAYLDRIAQVEPNVNAYITVTADEALAGARAADEARQQGDDRPLLGVPLAVKDAFSTKDVLTTGASRILEGYVPPFNATAVQRLADAGSVLLGKTNMDEFAMGSTTENSAMGATRNPWDTSRIPGGSSGGSAAAVAAREAAGALGSDTGGSIRQPGAMCGVVGVKPSYGRVSRYGLSAFGSSLDTVGTLSRTVEDAARMLSVLAGVDPMDSTTVDAPVPDYVAGLTGDIRGLRVGIPNEYFVDGIQPEVEAAVRAAIDQLVKLGAEVVPVSLPHTEYTMPVYYIIAPAEASANLARFDGIRYGKKIDKVDLWDTYRATRGEGFGPEVKRRIMLGTYVLSAGYYDAYYAKAQQVRTLIRRDFDQVFADVDVLAAPVSPTTAFKLGSKVDDPVTMYLDDMFTLPASLAGLCGVSVPCGFDNDGLPIGFQLIGKAFGEDVVLRAAHAYEQSTDWHQKLAAGV